MAVVFLPAAAATTKATISTAATVAGALASAGGAILQGRQAQQQANFQAAVQRQQAERERQIAERQEEDFRRRQSRQMAARRAALGGSGIDPSVGSPLLVSQDFAAEQEFQALTIRAGGEDRATRLEQSAQLQRLAGRNAARSGLVRGGALLLTGAGKAFA